MRAATGAAYHGAYPMKGHIRNTAARAFDHRAYRWADALPDCQCPMVRHDQSEISWKQKTQATLSPLRPAALRSEHPSEGNSRLCIATGYDSPARSESGPRPEKRPARRARNVPDRRKAEGKPSIGPSGWAWSAPLRQPKRRLAISRRERGRGVSFG